MNELTQSEQGQAPRLRLAKHIDLKKADPNCERCKGTGVVRVEKVEEQGGLLDVPVVCRCVSRAGGVVRDMFDKMVDEMHEQVQNGTFAENLAVDIMRLPKSDRINAVEQLRKQLKKAKQLHDVAVVKQLKSALARVALMRAEER